MTNLTISRTTLHRCSQLCKCDVLDAATRQPRPAQRPRSGGRARSRRLTGSSPSRWPCSCSPPDDDGEDDDDDDVDDDDGEDDDGDDDDGEDGRVPVRHLDRLVHVDVGEEVRAAAPLAILVEAIRPTW